MSSSSANAQTPGAAEATGAASEVAVDTGSSTMDVQDLNVNGDAWWSDIMIGHLKSCVDFTLFDGITDAMILSVPPGVYYRIDPTFAKLVVYRRLEKTYDFCVYSLATRELMWSIVTPKEESAYILPKFCAHGSRWVIYTYGQPLLKLVESETGEVIVSRSVDAGLVDVQLSSDDARMAVCTFSGTLTVLDAASFEPLYSVNSDAFVCTQFIAHDTIILATSRKTDAFINMNAATGEIVCQSGTMPPSKTIEMLNGTTIFVAHHKGKAKVIGVDYTNMATVWEITNGTGQADTIIDVCLTTGGTVVVCLCDLYIVAYDIATKQQLYRLEGRFTNIDYIPANDTFLTSITGGKDAYVYLAKTGQKVAEKKFNVKILSSVFFFVRPPMTILM